MLLSAVGSFIVFILMLIGLPYLTGPAMTGVAYLVAIVVFILVISGAGIMVNKKIT